VTFSIYKCQIIKLKNINGVFLNKLLDTYTDYKVRDSVSYDDFKYYFEGYEKLLNQTLLPLSI